MPKRFFNAPLSIGLSLSAVAFSLIAPDPHKPPTTTADYSIAFNSPRAMTIDPTTQAVTLKAID